MTIPFGVFAFPGNVRQLENICHWLTVMAPAQLIDEKDLLWHPAELPHGVGEARQRNLNYCEEKGEASLSVEFVDDFLAGVERLVVAVQRALLRRAAVVREIMST